MTCFSTKVCASRYFFPDVAARMALLFDTPMSFTRVSKHCGRKPHNFIIVREIIAAQRHFRDDHHAVPYIQFDEIGERQGLPNRKPFAFQKQILGNQQT